MTSKTNMEGGRQLFWEMLNKFNNPDQEGTLFFKLVGGLELWKIELAQLSFSLVLGPQQSLPSSVHAITVRRNDHRKILKKLFSVFSLVEHYSLRLSNNLIQDYLLFASEICLTKVFGAKRREFWLSLLDQVLHNWGVVERGSIAYNFVFWGGSKYILEKSIDQDLH